MAYPEEKEYSPETSFNIDLELWDVSFIGIPTSLENIKIQQIPLDLLPENIDKDLCKYDRKIFEISTPTNKYYIIAGGLLIAVNRWEKEDRIFDNHLNLEHDKILLKV
ncbi:hypothetical protein AR687_23280 [Flavobacteriaceae bacterium CRH]|nr:hypothetical protein AR687_23280 [Flavobacteriaceae bacterium CRH]